MKFNITQLFAIGNISKALAAEVNVLISIINRRYIKEVIVDGDPKPGLKKDAFNNVFLRYRFKEIKPREEFPAYSYSIIDTQGIDESDWFFSDKRIAVTRKRIMLVYPEGLRRIRKISERLFHKSKLLIDFEKEIFEFIERNFEVIKNNLNEHETNNETLEDLLKNNVGTIDQITDFVIALHKNNNIKARKVHGYIYEKGAITPHSWLEVNIKGKWAPVDPVRKQIGKISENYIAKKIDFTERNIQDIQVKYKLSKNWYKQAIIVQREDFNIAPIENTAVNEREYV